MITTDEIYKQLTDLWWLVLEKNKVIERFKDEFFDVCLNDGYELDEIDEYWRM